MGLRSESSGSEDSIKQIQEEIKVKTTHREQVSYRSTYHQQSSIVPFLQNREVTEMDPKVIEKMNDLKQKEEQISAKVSNMSDEDLQRFVAQSSSEKKLSKDEFLQELARFK